MMAAITHRSTLEWLGSVTETMPQDGYAGTLVGRIWDPRVNGPSPVAIRPDGVFDISSSFPTVRDLCEDGSPASAVAAISGERVGELAQLLRNTAVPHRDPARPWLLAPIDLQTIKAAGVTFAVSPPLSELSKSECAAVLTRRNPCGGRFFNRSASICAAFDPVRPAALRLKEILLSEGESGARQSRLMRR